MVAIFIGVFCKKTFAKNEDAQDGIAVLELFTSQGCSSCPTADALLGKYALQNNPHIICLSFNVDYWNRLGWKDVFSNPFFSERQRIYDANLRSETFTPQVVINGNSQFIGSDEKNIRQCISKEDLKMQTAEVQVQQRLQANNVSIDYNLSGNFHGADLIACLIQNKTITKINTGENGGATLTEYNVVRDFKSVNNPSQKGNISLKIPKDIAAKDCSIILFIQQDHQRQIEGARMISL